MKDTLRLDSITGGSASLKSHYSIATVRFLAALTINATTLHQLVKELVPLRSALAMPSVVASPQFDCPGLKLDELVQLKALAEQNVMELVVKSDVRERSLGWTSVSRETDLAIYKAPDDSRQAWYYLGTMDVLGSVEEAAALFRDDTPELAAIFAPRFGQGIQDEALLYSIAAPSIHNNYMEKIAVKWFCAKSPLHNKLIKPRDACVLECHHAFKYSGRHGWARSLKSIRLASCPELLHSLGYNRVKTYVAGHVFVESEARQGHVTMYYIARADVAGTTHNCNGVVEYVKSISFCVKIGSRLAKLWDQ
ncbi:unnamed protein product [Aphanomyces euteiches]